MLATLVDEPFSCEGWLFEPKLDGERCLVFQGDTGVEFFSRNRKLLNPKYPELAEAFASQGNQAFIVDGEIVTLEDGVSSFARLQRRMQVQHPSAELRKEIPVWFYAFDLLYLEPYDLRQVPLRYRKGLLQESLNYREPLRFTEHRETDGQAYYREACKKQWEGLIAKKADAPYVSQRSRQWLKFKCVRGQELVIGGYTDPAGARLGFGALLAGYYERGKLKYAGKVGTGYDALTLQRLAKQLKRLETRVSPFHGDGPPNRSVHWVKPELVAQIGFTEWTGDGRLRHPRFLGLRNDKDALEVVRER